MPWEPSVTAWGEEGEGLPLVGKECVGVVSEVVGTWLNGKKENNLYNKLTHFTLKSEILAGT